MNVGYMQMVQWILANRKGDAFKDYAPLEILEELVRSVEDHLMLYSAKDGIITGIITAEDMEKNGKPLIHVRNVLVTDTEALINFFRKYKELYGSIPLVGTRRGRLHKINVDKILSKIKPKAIYG